jgi:hypothetical protein
MSNGIGANPLNAISKVYLDQIAEKKKDDTYLEPDMKKRQANNEKARKELAKGPQMKNPHFEEKQQGWDAVNTLADAYKNMTDVEEGMHRDAKKMSEGVRDIDPEKGTAERKARLEKKRGMKLDDHPQYKKEDVDNVDEMYKGKHGQSEKEYQDSRSDAGKQISGDSKMSGAAYSHRSFKGQGKPAKPGERQKAQGRMTQADRDELAIRKAALKKKSMKEAYSSWRQDLSEIMTDDIDSKPIKEKKNIKNTIKINPKLGESVEELGGEILEMVEVDQFDGIVEEVFQDLLSEGYDEQNVRDAIESGIEEAKITYGHDTSGGAERMRDKLRKKAKGFLGKVAVKAYNKAREAKAAATPALQRAKTSAKRGLRKAALKVADKLKEENVDEAVYGGTQPEKKDTRMIVTAADKKANTPAYQKYKAGDKRYKAADHLGEEGSMSAQEIALQKRKATIDQMIARKRKQSLDKGQSEQPAKAMGEELSIADQMRISREAAAKRKPYQPGDRQKQRAAQIRQMAKNAPKDTRTDAQKMTDATGPRPGSRYRGD